MKKSLATLALAGAMALSAQAQIIYSTVNSTYTQNFQTFTDSNLTASNSTVSNLTMQEVSGQPGGGSVSGWFFYGTASNTRWGRDNGSSNTGAFYAMRDGAGNLAFGSQGSNSNAGFFGAVFQNTTGITLDTITISFQAVINRNPATTVNPYNFSYLISSTSVNSTVGATGAGTFNNSAGTWIPNTSLSFTTPTIGTGAPGTQAAISPMFIIGNYTATLSTTWANGDYLYIRWSETDDSGADALAGVDNFSLQAIPEPGTFALLGAGLGALVIFRRRRQA